MTGVRAARSRVLSVVVITLVLLLAGSASAWAWWMASASATAAGTAPALAAPGGVDATCNPSFNFQNDPVVVSWNAVAVPAGATQVRYRVLFVNDAGGQSSFPSATTETTATSVSVVSTQLGTNNADRVRDQTITVQAFAVYPTGRLVSTASAAVTAHGENLLGVVDMHC
ncbi:hypothetical protein [Cellulomonas sp. Root137]|uniref:hypothetical protein n=1 Tax=Cellulomonas sp. Root137 TaxID=1736459 RepID=UPI0006F1D342|nr:hypothetical protein [Cellulomonas sp. Root137]KQY47173.1 hypothetical protein ASD18_07350 [Cellulomonas sp. Root137]